MPFNCPKCNAPLELKLATARSGAPSLPRKTDDNVDTSDLAGLLESIDDNALDAKSQEFVATTRERFEKYGAKTMMSARQMKWIREIATGESEW